MKEQHIIVNRTARFYTLGELTEKTKHVWFVLHGFGYLANNFLKTFEPLLTPETFFIAPEALSRFYLKDAGGNVGATWMTKEDRLNEIKDYIHYLDDLYEHFELEKYAHAKITALGFSQGSSTLTRWLNATQHKVDNAVFYAGEIPVEVFPLQQHSGLKNSKNYFIYGDQDKFFSLEVFQKIKDAAGELNLTTIQFEGKHEVVPETLRGLF